LGGKDVSESHEAEQGSTETTEPHATGSQSGFSAIEASALHADDRVAAGHIVKLMVGIFLVGVVIYSIVALICSRGP
jgi:hypothetical protein